jgi:hypothetical protein
MPLSAAAIENLLKVYKNEAPTKKEKVWVKLHTGDPGAAGTENAAGETKRVFATLTVGTTTLKNSGALEWPGVSTSETYKWVSIWSAESGGTFEGRGQLEAEKAVSKEDTAKVPAEGFSISIT